MKKLLAKETKKKELPINKPLSFLEIQKKFESKSYSDRLDFINEYHFKDDYKIYYLKFITKHSEIKDFLYLSELIDLSGYLGFQSDRLYNRFIKYLFGINHFLVKLAVFDYLKRADRFYEDKNGENLILKFFKYSKHIKSGRGFLLCMAYKLLIQWHEYNKNLVRSNELLRILIKEVENQENPAIYWRLYNDAISEPSLARLRKRIVRFVKFKNKQYNFNFTFKT